MFIRGQGINISKQLRPGRQQLSREEVRTHQRERIFLALETVMPAKGYAETSVADIITEAGVSRQTFYELFESKQDCFLASWGRRQGAMLGAIAATVDEASPIERFAAVLQTYLVIMASVPALSSLYLIGVYAAGREAIVKRIELQRQFVDGIAEILDARSDQDRFACQALVSAISTLVTNALQEGDPQAVLDLHEPLVGIARQLMTVH